MPVLHNLVSNKELKERMLAETEPRTTVSFYKYFQIADPKAFRDALYVEMTRLKVFGRVYVAHEGINAQISVPASQYEAMKAALYAFDPAFNNLRMNIALDDDGKSFWVLRLKVRERIVADGIEDTSFDASDVGAYLKAADVNALLDDPEVVFVDMRNHYEFEWGISIMPLKSRLIRSAINCRWQWICCKTRKTKKLSCTAPAAFAVKKPARG
jgi:Predicted sulfurtransferase